MDMDLFSVTLNQLLEMVIDAQTANDADKVAALEAELKTRTEKRFDRVMGLAKVWAEENDGQGHLPTMEEKIKIVLADPGCDDWEDDWIIEEVTEMCLSGADDSAA